MGEGRRVKLTFDPENHSVVGFDRGGVGKEEVNIEEEAIDETVLLLKRKRELRRRQEERHKVDEIYEHDPKHSRWNRL